MFDLSYPKQQYNMRDMVRLENYTMWKELKMVHEITFFQFVQNTNTFWNFTFNIINVDIPFQVTIYLTFYVFLENLHLLLRLE